MPAIRVQEMTVADTRPLRQAVLRPHETVEEMAAREVSDAYALGAFLDGRLVGVGMIMPDGSDREPDGGVVDATAWRVRGMATLPESRGAGAGTAVLDGLIAHARRNGAERIWCNARTPALNLYRRAGFEVVSEEFQLPDIGPHRRMELRLAERR